MLNVPSSELRLLNTRIFISLGDRTSPDAGDDLVVDCAMNAGAIVVTSKRMFEKYKKLLRFAAIPPVIQNHGLSGKVH
ncbi:hypothetical protein ACKFKF_33645 [Phormidesmis sp. 146-12]